MNAVLEHPVLRSQVIPMTLEAYQIMTERGLIDENTELIHGFVLTKMSKSPRHSIITKRLFTLLNSKLPSNCSLWKEEPLTLGDSEPEPDLAIVLGNDEEFAHAHPSTAELVIEVALSSVDRDQVKADIYAKAGVKEYWLVNADSAWVDLHTRPTAQGYAMKRRFAAGETVVSTVIQGVEAEVSALFA